MEKFRRNALFLTSLSLFALFGILYLSSSINTSNIEKDNTKYNQIDNPIHNLNNTSITFELSNNNEFLTIKGSGEIDDFSDLSTRPWDSYSQTITQIEFGSEITSIGENAFKDFVNLTNVTFPEATKTIKNYAFANCSNLNFIAFSTEFPNELNISSNAFEGIGSTGDICVPKDLSSNYECIKVSSLSSWNIIEKTPFINNEQAWWAYSLSKQSLHIDGYGDMDDYNFGPPSVIPTPWYNYSSQIETIYIGQHITKIGSFAFYECSKIESLILGENVATINKNSFAFCADLYTLILSKNITTINTQAFLECKNLSTVYFLGTSIATIGDNAFPITSTPQAFYIVPNSTSIYEPLLNNFTLGTDGWEIIETMMERPEVDGEIPPVSTTAIDVKFKIEDTDPAVIYYTLDGSIPNQYTGIKYTPGEKIHIDSENNTSKEVTINAIKTRKLWTDSEVSSFTYKVLNRIEYPLIDAEEKILTYNGSPQTIHIKESPLYTITGNTQTNAGNYSITISLKDKENHVWADGSFDDHTIDFTIKKATFDTSTFDFVNKTVEYNKEVQRIEITGTLPKGLSVTYTNNEGTIVGEYHATASFVYDTNNYNDVSSKSAILKITKRHIPFPEIINEGKVYIYDGSLQTFELSESEYYKIEGNKQTIAGIHTVTVSLFDTNNTYWDDGRNDKTLEYDFVIIKGTYDLSNAPFESTSIEYDGNEHTIVHNGTLPQGLTVSYEGKGTVVGKYEITATYEGDFENYNEIQPKTVELTITPHIVAKPQIDNRTFTYNKQEQTYNVTLSDYYTVSNYIQTNAGSYEVKYVLKDKVNTCWENETTEDIIFPFTIHKAVYDLSSISLNDKKVEYDGKPHTLEITGELPEGLTCESVEGFHTEIGTYDIHIRFTSSDTNYEIINDMVGTLTITKIGVDKPAQDNAEFVYNGQEQTYTIASSELYTITNNVQVNASKYNVEITLKDEEHYSWKGDNEDSHPLIYSFTINKAKYDMSGISFKNEEVTYDGSSHRIDIKGTLPDGVKVSYNGHGTNVGTYSISVSFTSDEIENGNYESIKDMHATLTINPFIINRPLKDTTVFTYNGNVQTYIVPESEYYRVLNHSNEKTEAGTYVVQIKLINNNYCWDNTVKEILEYPFIIQKATYDVSGISFSNKTFEYNGEIHSLEYEGTLPSGVTVSYENNSQTKPGTYEVTLIFHVDSNHNNIESKTATLTISPAIEELNNNGTSISTEEGFITTVSLSSNVIDFREESYSAYVKNNEKLIGVYDIKVLNTDGSEYILDPNKTYTLRIKLPSTINEDMDFIVSHIHNASEIHYIRKGSAPAIGAYTIEDGYLVTKINKLSHFLFIEEIQVQVQETSFIQYIQTLVLGGFIAFFLIYSIILKHRYFSKWSIMCLSIFGISTLITVFFSNGAFSLIINIISVCILLGASIFYSLYTFKVLPLPKKYVVEQEESKDETIEDDKEDLVIEESDEKEIEENVETPLSQETLLDNNEIDVVNEDSTSIQVEENNDEDKKESPISEEETDNKEENNKPKKKRTYKKKTFSQIEEDK